MASDTIFVVLAKSANDNAPYDARWFQHVLMYVVAIAVCPVLATRANLFAEEDCTVLPVTVRVALRFLFEYDDLSGDLVYVEQLAHYFKSAPSRLVVLLPCHSEKMGTFICTSVTKTIACPSSRVSGGWSQACHRRELELGHG